MTIEPTSTPGVYRAVYWVNLQEQSCDCPSGQLSDKECRHLKAAKQYAQGEPVRFWERG